MRLAFLLALIGCITSPELPSGAHAPNEAQRAILQAAFDSVSRCSGHTMPAPTFYVVDGVAKFDVHDGNGEADGYFQPTLHSITVTTLGWLTPEALADTSAAHRIYFGEMFRWVAMHEAMHAISGERTHREALFGQHGPCGVLAWWYDLKQPAPVP